MREPGLRLTDLPGEDATDAELIAFAGSFDGYRHAGGLHEAAAIAAVSENCGSQEAKDTDMPTTPSTKTVSFGGCNFGKVSPQLDDLRPDTKILSVTLSFEDALKLNLAVDECVRKLNSYNRATAKGKRTALQLSIHLDGGRVTVKEGRI